MEKGPFRTGTTQDRRTALSALACGLSATCFLSAFRSARAQSGAPSLRAADLDAQINRLVTEPVAGTVLVGHGDAILDIIGIGQSNPRDHARNTPQTVFDIGSIAKLYTSSLVFQLVSEESLSLDSKLGDFLSGLPTETAGITVRQCLNHSSGLPTYFSGGDFSKKSREKAINELRRMRLLSSPGGVWSYSNVGYGALALVVEEVTRTSFPEAMRARILEPNELRSTGFFGDFQTHADPVAFGFAGRKIFGSPTTWNAPQWGLLGGGGMATSAPDLFNFFRLLVQDRLFDPALHEELLEKRIPMQGKSANWGNVSDNEGAAGLFSFRDAAGRLVFHKGGSGNYGFFSTLIWRPDVDLIAIGLFNSGVKPGFGDDDVVDASAMEHSTLYRRLLSLLDS